MTGELILGDALKKLQEMPAETFSAIVTSPPYNLSAKRLPHPSNRWNASRLQREGYDGHDDAMPVAEYIAYHQRCVEEMMRVLRSDGCLFYNHRERVQGGQIEEHGLEITRLYLRQRIVWARAGGLNHDSHFFVPSHEYIYLCPKEGWRRERVSGEPATTVWRIPQTRRIGHPAPFPIELARRCLEMGGGKGPVLDPFVGSGQTAIAAERLGMEWVGIDKSAEYIALARQRIEEEVQQRRMSL